MIEIELLKKLFHVGKIKIHVVNDGADYAVVSKKYVFGEDAEGEHLVLEIEISRTVGW